MPILDGHGSATGPGPEAQPSTAARSGGAPRTQTWAGASGTVEAEQKIVEIEHRFRRSTLSSLSFYVNEDGTRVRVTLSRSAPGSAHVERLVVRSAPFHSLTTREHEIATAVALGLSNEEIGEFTSLSKRTVDRHVSNVLTRLGFQNRAQLAAFVAGTEGWMVPFPAGSVLEDRVPVLGLLSDTPLRHDGGAAAVEVAVPTLHIGSLLPSDAEKQMEALAMSRGEDLAVTGTPADRALCSRFPVRITRIVAAGDDIDDAVSELRRAGIHALTIGNFDISSAERILENEDLRGITVLHSMVNRRIHSFTDPNPDYAHVFQMCADESVYLRALAAYVRKFVPEAARLSVVIRVSDNVEVIDTVKTALGPDAEVEVQVIRIDDQGENLAEIALELLHFNPDTVYLGVYVESVLVELLSHIRALRLDAQLFGVWVPGLPGFTQRHPELAEGLVWSTLVGNSNNHFGNQFRAAFEATYRSSPGIGSAAVHYDMIGLLRRAWQDAGLEASSGPIIEALNSVRFTGVTGSFHFDDGRRRRALCFPFDTDDPAIGQPCLTFRIHRGKSVPIFLLDGVPGG